MMQNVIAYGYEKAVGRTDEKLIYVVEFNPVNGKFHLRHTLSKNFDKWFDHGYDAIKYMTQCMLYKFKRGWIITYSVMRAL